MEINEKQKDIIFDALRIAIAVCKLEQEKADLFGDMRQIAQWWDQIKRFESVRFDLE